MVRLYTSGDVDTVLLVDTADPDAGVLAVTVQEPGGPDRPKVTMTMCATCEHWPGEQPRRHGYLLYKAATAIWEEGRWPAAALWECTDLEDPVRRHSPRTDRLRRRHRPQRPRPRPLPMRARPLGPYQPREVARPRTRP
ncbi:hypothetical protein ACU686_26270 [Yinghuangia aomiensis]